MILTFSKERFVHDIKNGTKIHTIREDRTGRWKPGMKIHFWKGNPRNRAGHPYPFPQNRAVPHGETVVKSIQKIQIHHVPAPMKISGPLQFNETSLEVHVDGRALSAMDLIQLVENDGLLIRSFVSWFVPLPGDQFEGKIIHWTDLKY